MQFVEDSDTSTNLFLITSTSASVVLPMCQGCVLII